MEAINNVEMEEIVLDIIDKSNQRLNNLNSLMENYKFQMENIGEKSSLGQELRRDMSFLKEEKERLINQIEELKQYIAGFNLDSIENNNKEIVQEPKVTSDDIKLEELPKEEVHDIAEEVVTESNSNCDYYKISSVAAFRNDKILDAYLIEDEKEIYSKVSQLYYEYGNDISIKLNYDGYVVDNKEPIYENMGWIDLEEYQFSSNKNIMPSEKVTEVKEENSKEIIQETIKTDQQNVIEGEQEEEYAFNSIADCYQEGSISSFKVVYKNGKYRISFDIVEDGEIVRKTYVNNISFKALYSQYYKKELAKEYGIDPKSKFYHNMDVNLLLSLKKIDKEYGTDYTLDYINGLLNIRLKYDLKSHFSNKNLKLFDRFIQRKIALKQRKITNARVNGAHYQQLAVGVVSSLVLMVTLGISSILPSFAKKNKQDLVENKKQAEREITTTTITTTEEVTTEEIIEKILNQKETNQKETNQKETNDLGLDDGLVLVNKDKKGNVIYTFKLSEELNNKGNKVLASDYSDCNKFKISALAICDNGKKLIVLDKTNNNEDLRTNDLYDKYGKDIDIEINFDAYKDNQETPVYKNIGWLKLKDFKIGTSKSYVAKEDLEIVKEEIQKENAANSIVEEEAINSANEENTKEYGYCKFGLDDKIKLFVKNSEGEVTFSQKLSGDAWGNGEVIDVGKLDCDYFKISYMAVYNGSNVLDIREIKEEDNVDNIANSMYQTYGADIDIAFNFNGYYDNQDENNLSYKYIGWLNIDKIVNVTENMKEQVSGNANTITQKTYIKK